MIVSASNPLLTGSGQFSSIKYYATFYLRRHLATINTCFRNILSFPKDPKVLQYMTTYVEHLKQASKTSSSRLRLDYIRGNLELKIRPSETKHGHKMRTKGFDLGVRFKCDESQPHIFGYGGRNHGGLTCSATQRHALLLFKFSINHSYDGHDFPCHADLGSGYYPIMMQWRTSIDCCNWDGVTCNHLTGDVISLDLSCGMLQGTIHPNTTLFNLPHLERLNLAFNDFTGSQLPPEIGRFSNSLTYFNISQCGFMGQVPSDISHLHKLVSLDLSSNYFDFRIQPHVFYNLLHNSTSLEELLLHNVNISSSLPTYLNLSSLKSLNLRSTSLQGKLPDNLFSLQHLEKLDLAFNNDLTSQLPKVNRSTSLPLKWLDLSFNIGLSGEICYSIGHLKSLNHLDLSYTYLSGEVPYSIGHLKSLNYLDLSHTGLSGEIPYSTGHLKSLNTLLLSSCGFVGPLPKSIVNLMHITTLDLSSNMLNGSLPSELFTMNSLKELSIGGNQFVGEINVLDKGLTLQTFQQLVNLTQLDLSFNSFTGHWDLDTLLSSLKTLVELRLSYSGLSVITNNSNRYVNPDFLVLFMASCKLTVFPESLRAMKKLQYLDMSSNEIHGCIPDWAGEIGGDELYFLNLSHNFITGLPQFQWGGLSYLDLQSNVIQGSFPPSICNMRNLWYLDMSNNSFTGVIPQCSRNIILSIALIDMGSNRFQGTIPNVYEHCGQLMGLILNGNQLEGEGAEFFVQMSILASLLPRKYFQNFGAMKNVVKKNTKPDYLIVNGKFYSIIVTVKGLQLSFEKFFVDYTIVDLSHNKFDGEIPNEIVSLNSLKVLNLSHNNLNGRIPYTLGNLSEIESLDLSWNQLTGEIPQSLASITTLEVLNLSRNHLVGRIPHGTQFNTFEGSSFGGNSALCGFPLAKHCEHASAPKLEVDGEEESGFTWKVVMLGYGCGTLLGLVLGYLMLSTGRPKWFNAIADMVHRKYMIYIGK
ncbi:hypothetical protein OSB04_017284 [Centaurea solstitialis]|uniref:Leucine-rich repeat-containing N-terminal plant-type domain-containing protein n=1 Tax=Centaurea solstitialis TaxID=347529 RepID=A0AA38T484_9ASTR|nr:hypothetical protein OSB04_017284 [Centaurea solstitialis]